MGAFNRVGKSIWAHIFYRFVQMVFGAAVIGLYAQDLNRAARAHKYSDGKWIFAVVVGSLGAVTAIVYMIVLLIAGNFWIAILFGWDLVLFIIWTAVFGLFGSMYIHEKVQMQPGIQRMKNAVWVDLVNMLLWLVSAIGGFWLFFHYRHHGGRSLHTGRAKA